MVRIASDVRPDVVTLVPERQEEITTEGGLDLSLESESVRAAIAELHEAGIVVSLFVDPDRSRSAPATGSTRTGWRSTRPLLRVATSPAAPGDREGPGGGEAHLEARDAGLRRPRAQLPQRPPRGADPGDGELNIGHSIVSRAALVGMERAVREMADLLERP